jgi:phosphoglycerate dehydrogenase-like enzyme
MRLHVHLLNIHSSIGTQPLLAQLDPSIHVTEGPELVDPESIAVLVGGFPRADQLAVCTALQALIVPFTGVPTETQQMMQGRPEVSLHNLHYNVVPTAEMAIALLMAAAKLIVPMDRDLRAGDWSSRYIVTDATILDRKTALILGYGQIGRRIARGCRGLGMEVIGVKRTPPDANSACDAEGAEVHAIADLPSLLPRADALIMVLPETPETTGLVGARDLAALRPGALLVNVGRGPTLDEEALYRALRDGTLRAAGIDVWYEYPQTLAERTNKAPSRFPFHELDNVVMSPHRGGWLSEAEVDRLDQLAALLNAAARGEPIPSVVDKTLGY